MAERNGRVVLRGAAREVLGPALITTAVLVVLHDMAFGGRAPSQQNDVLGFWFPTHCFLGRSLAAGDIPLWNPHVMAGHPFAADPQSGWMYLPAMALYSILPCDAALPVFLVLQPILAGVAMYWFLRSEELSRPAATVGGLCLAMVITASRLVVSIPVSAALAWSAVLLALTAKTLRAGRWSTRLGWLGLTAVAWGQLASAHMSHGLALGTATAVAYLAARGIADVRAGRRTTRQVVGLGLLFIVALIGINLAVLLPRIAYLPRTILGLGYDGLRDLTVHVTGEVPHLVIPRATGGYSWPLKLGTSPGAYVGAAAVSLSFAGLWSRRLRPLVVSAAAIGAGSYLLSLPGVARFLAPAVGRLPLGDVYLHASSRMRFGVLLVLPVLAAAGIDTWQESGPRRRWGLAGLGAAVWLVGPAAVGISPRYLVVPWIGAVVAAGILWLSVRRPAALTALPAAVAAELAIAALVGQSAPAQLAVAPSRLEVAWRHHFENLLEPDIDPAAYLEAGPNAAAIRAGTGRYLTLQPWREARAKGYVGRWHPGDEGLLDNQRAMVLGLEDAQGYNPVQPLRSWILSRRLNPAPPKYNVTVFTEPDPRVLDLWQVNWLVGPEDPPAPGFVPVSTETSWVVHRGATRPRASLFTEWSVASGPDDALAHVSSPRFVPARSVVVEGDPGLRIEPGAPGTAVYRSLGPEDAEVEVVARAPSILLVRNAFDPNWHATMDGREVPLLAANYAFQAIAVPPGRHVVQLRYRDPWVGAGLVGSALAAAAVGMVWALVRRRERGGQSGTAGTRAGAPGAAAR